MFKSVPISAVYAKFILARCSRNNGIAPHSKIAPNSRAMSSGAIISTFALLVTFCAQVCRGPFRPHGSAMSRSR